jgi:hypothetical protein
MSIQSHPCHNKFEDSHLLLLFEERDLKIPVEHQLFADCI